MIENNELIIKKLECLAMAKYNKVSYQATEKIKLEDIVELFDYKRIPLSSREREQKKGKYPYYGATGVLDYVDDYLFSGEYILLAEDGTVIDSNGHPIIQFIDGEFWVNNHAHILKARTPYNDYSLFAALKKLNVSKAVTGAVQQKINQSNLLSLEISQLSACDLKTLNSEFELIFLRIFSARKEIVKLRELKALYLKKFFG